MDGLAELGSARSDSHVGWRPLSLLHGGGSSATLALNKYWEKKGIII